MATASQKVVEAVVEVVSSTDAPVTGEFLARRLRMHKTTVTAAANEAVRRGLLNRTKLTTNSRGSRPWGYTQLLEGDVVDPTVFEKHSRSRKPRKLKRGTAEQKIAAVVATYKAGTGGRGFTVRELESKIKGTTYETIRKAIVKLHNEGLIEDTGRHRKGSVVYRPVAEKGGKKPAQPAPDFPGLPKPKPPPPVVEPDVPEPTPPTPEPGTPPPVNSIEALVVERADLRQQVKVAEKRINEIEREFARVRSLLG